MKIIHQKSHLTQCDLAVSVCIVSQSAIVPRTCFRCRGRNDRRTGGSSPSWRGRRGRRLLEHRRHWNKNETLWFQVHMQPREPVLPVVTVQGVYRRTGECQYRCRPRVDGNVVAQESQGQCRLRSKIPTPQSNERKRPWVGNRSCIVCTENRRKNSPSPRLVSINQSINGSINQPINKSINQSIDQSIHQPINQSIDQSINQSINQSIDPSMDQSINRSIDHYNTKLQDCPEAIRKLLLSWHDGGHQPSWRQCREIPC